MTKVDRDTLYAPDTGFSIQELKEACLAIALGVGNREHMTDIKMGAARTLINRHGKHPDYLAGRLGSETAALLRYQALMELYPEG